MDWKPDPPDLLRAVAVYLPAAYGDAPVPKSVATRIDALTVAGDAVYAHAAIERDVTQPDARLSVRLGNRAYPHMKLVVERTPDGRGHLFRADTHDRHIQPKPGTRDAELFTKLMVENGKIAEAIEAAWEAAGVATFKAYLREDLRRRAAAAARGDTA